ncbi:marvel domain-containing protein [Usnea florida]
MPSIPNLALRGLQLFFSILILGLSGHLVANQAYGGAPSATNYNVFLGIWLFVTAVMGLAASVLEVLGGVVGAVADGLSVLFAFAGGVAYAAKLGVHSCSRTSYTSTNSIINGGIKDNKIGPVNLKHRCQEAQADTAFIWFAFATALGCLALGLLSWRRGGK